jgi:hypothetical protein
MAFHYWHNLTRGLYHILVMSWQWLKGVNISLHVQYMWVRNTRFINLYHHMPRCLYRKFSEWYATITNSIGITLVGRTAKGSKFPLPIFFLPKNSFFWLLNWREANKKIGVRVGQRGVCILRTGSSQSSPSF